MTDIDLTLSPWDRLAKLAPPGTNVVDLQEAASRWSLTADVYAAAADIWEDKLMTIDNAPDVNTQDPSDLATMGGISRVRQDGILIDFAVSATFGNTQAARRSQSIQIKTIIRRLRAKAKPHSPLVHSQRYNPWRNMPRCMCFCHNANGVPNTSFNCDDDGYSWTTDSGSVYGPDTQCSCTCGQFIIIDNGE